MKRVLSNEVSQFVGNPVTVSGWVQSRRDHGGLIFIDVRDHKGLIQVVSNPDNPEVFAVADGLRDEYVVKITGRVVERAEGLANPNIESGGVEIVADEVIILNKSEVLPIQPFSEAQANEELRLKYRYLDLRRPKMQQRLRQRHEYNKFIRAYMEERDFVEVATPILANSSPEGARDFLIPARLHEGKFYALPQAPQQFKQLLMVGGVPRYYQLAACFRDEDPRADRLYGEFYQLDLEMSFVEDGEEVRSTMEPLIKDLVTGFAGKSLLTEDIPRLTHKEAMEKYGSDKPDLRFEMELTELTDIFSETDFAVFKQAGTIKAILVKDAASLSRKQIDKFTEIAKREGAGGLAYIKYVDGADAAEGELVVSGLKPEAPIAKFISQAEHEALIKRLKPEAGDAIFFGADARATVNKVLGKLRNSFADHFELKDPSVVALAWVVDFPFYEWSESERKVDFGHNPFSMPRGGVESLRNAKTDEEKLEIVADQYDLVMNGYEVCSGAVRNHNPEVMYEAFGMLGYDKAYVEEKFGAMLNAFKYGAPPHAGCAFGVDRMFMVLVDEDNIREVIAFPKNGSGVDVMMNAPSSGDPALLKDLGL